jgi:hypothetical protein
MPALPILVAEISATILSRKPLPRDSSDSPEASWFMTTIVTGLAGVAASILFLRAANIFSAARPAAL